MKKKCRVCGQPKDSYAFGSNRNERDGLMRVCRACRSHQRAIGPRYAVTVKSKKCRECLITKRASAFTVNASVKTGLDRAIKQPLFCKSRYEQAGHLAFMFR